MPFLTSETFRKVGGAVATFTGATIVICDTIGVVSPTVHEQAYTPFFLLVIEYISRNVGFVAILRAGRVTDNIE